METALSRSAEEIPSGTYVTSLNETNDYCFEHNGVIVDYSSILNTVELKIADDLTKSLENCEAAVFKAYELFDGDFDAFLRSDLCKLLTNQRISKALRTYDRKIQEYGITAKYLDGLTSKKLTEMFTGEDQKITILTRLRGTMQKQLQRTSNEIIQIFKNLWVILFTLC